MRIQLHMHKHIREWRIRRERKAMDRHADTLRLFVKDIATSAAISIACFRYRAKVCDCGAAKLKLELDPGVDMVGMRLAEHTLRLKHIQVFPPQTFSVHSSFAVHNSWTTLSRGNSAEKFCWISEQSGTESTAQG